MDAHSWLIQMRESCVNIATALKKTLPQKDRQRLHSSTNKKMKTNLAYMSRKQLEERIRVMQCEMKNKIDM